MKATSSLKIARRIGDIKYARRHYKSGKALKAERRAINKAIRQEGRRIIAEALS